MKSLTPFGKNKGLKGTTTFGCLIFLILAGALTYGGFKIGEAFWNYFEVRYKVQEALNWAVAGSYKTEVQISEIFGLIYRLVKVFPLDGRYIQLEIRFFFPADKLLCPASYFPKFLY